MPHVGDQFARLLVQHDRELRCYIAMLLPRRDDVEEVMQRTAVVLWEKFELFDEQREFLPWATRFAYFEVLNFRKEKARSRLVYSEDVMQSLAETRQRVSEEISQRRSILQKCLEKLDSEARLLIGRRYGDALTISALAEETGRTAKSLYRRLDRIRDSISACVDRKIAAANDES